ncbi:ATP-binding cassette sub-family G member 1-like isoform X2 [Photinus pyralis]|nr:ATP-binding cassette sub-family G member 1-like isoform X2 [Photinus pyralis]
MCAYIMQEDLLPQLMTVDELMIVAAKLKLGDNVSAEQQRETVNGILKMLGLESCRQTRTEAISGGQRKRLSVAVELVNNPPIILLDEPTSGLDTVAVNNCIDVFEVLAAQGRTVICTIHQPPASVFQKFHQTYFLADGICVYNGTISEIVPHLASVGITCPVTYTPSEYIIEVTHGNKECSSALSQVIHNGKSNRKGMSDQYITRRGVYEDTTEVKLNFNFPTSFWSQFCILYARMLLQLSRNKAGISLQLFSHSVAAVLLGTLFFGIGNNAEMALGNFFFCLAVCMFFIFTYLMTPAITYPTEIKILKREYFNRWYGLKPYFLAVTLQNVPLLLTLGILVILVTYGLTYQPVEVTRFCYFMLTGILIAIATEGLGLAVGSIFNVANGTVVASAIAAPLVILCVYGMGYGSTIESYMKVIMGISYVRFGVVAAMTAIFQDRGPFDCFHEYYCHYKDPNQMLKDLGMLDASYSINMLALGIYALIFRLIAFLAIRYRLTSQFSTSTISNYVNKILEH